MEEKKKWREKESWFSSSSGKQHQPLVFVRYDSVLVTDSEAS